MKKLEEKLNQWKRKAHNIYSQEMLLTHRMNDTLALLSNSRSKSHLERSQIYKGICSDIEKITFGVEYGFYNEETPSKSKEFYRAVFWNLKGQVTYQGLARLIKKHPLLNRADIFYFVHSDIGMARSENRNLIRSLALERSYNYITMCSFLHLNTWPEGPRQNLFGIEGVSIMTKYPMANFRMIPLRNSYDPVKGKSKKIGCEKAMMVDLNLDHHKLTFMGVKLDAFSSPAQRVKQLKFVFDEMKDDEKDNPILFAGDLQSTTYNTQNHASLLLNVLSKVIRGFDLVATEHHAHPYLFFEKKLFDVFLQNRFHFESLNNLESSTIHLKLEEMVREKGWSTQFTRKMIQGLRRLFFSKHKDFALKPDWFAANERIQVAQAFHAEKPKLIENYSLNDSDVITHAPMVLDFEIH